MLASARAYRRALREAGIPVQRVILFGSRAKGTHHRWSDIDLAIVSLAFGKDPFAERSKLMRLRKDLSPAIEPHPFHPDDFKDRWSTLAQEIKKYGIPIRP